MRKQLCVLLIIIVCLLLMGCTKNHQEVDLSNTEKIEVVSVNEPEFVLCTIEKREEIDEFIEKLKVESWNNENIPTDATESNMYKIYKPQIEKFMDRSQDNESEIVAIITTFKDSSFIKFETKYVTLNFKVPKDVVEYLSNLIES